MIFNNKFGGSKKIIHQHSKAEKGKANYNTITIIQYKISEKYIDNTKINETI